MDRDERLHRVGRCQGVNRASQSSFEILDRNPRSISQISVTLAPRLASIKKPVLPPSFRLRSFPMR